MKKTKQNKPKDFKKAKKTGKADQTDPDDEPKTFDFGGLPARDLKKNLGCG